MDHSGDYTPQGELLLQVVAMPADTNPAGDIFGGWLMSQADLAGSVLAYRRAQGRVATVAVNEFRFLRPVYVGDLVGGFGRIVKTGRTSVTVEVEIHVDRDRSPDQRILVADALLTYVALDCDGHKRLLP